MCSGEDYSGDPGSKEMKEFENLESFQCEIWLSWWNGIYTRKEKWVMSTYTMRKRVGDVSSTEKQGKCFCEYHRKILEDEKGEF